MPTGSLPLLRRVLSALLAGVFLLAAPLGELPVFVALPTPAAVVVVDDSVADAPALLPLPRPLLVRPSLPLEQILAVPVVTAEQAAALPAHGLEVVRVPSDRIRVGRVTAARNWAVTTGLLQWHPRPGVALLVSLLLGFALGTGRWATRSLFVLGLFGAGLGLSIVSLWLPASLFIALPAAWLVADLSYLVGMFAWAELWIAAHPRPRPATAPTPLPIAHR